MDIHNFRNILAGSTVVVLGNGPSLSETPLDILSKKYVTFGSNHIYRLPFTPTYYSFVDRQMLEFLPLPEWFKPRELFLRAEACVPGNNPIYPIVWPGFSVDISNFVVFGGSATYVLLQIAFYMGVKRVLLAGVDHYYPNAGSRDPGEMFIAGNDDPDHFQCGDGMPYYLPGKQYCRPSLAAVTEYYRNAESIYRKAGRKIINITPNSHLGVFEKGDIKTWTTN
jgi:hypothetical protein